MDEHTIKLYLILSLFFAFAPMVRRTAHNDLQKIHRFTSFFPQVLVVSLLIAPFFLFVFGTGRSLSLLIRAFLAVAVYDTLLLLLLPLLRRFLSASGCAMLWVVPTFLYLNYTSIFTKPFLIVHVPRGLMSVLFPLWLTGVVVVLVWHIAVHCSFRFRILRDAVEVTDPTTRSVWEEEVARADLAEFRAKLVRSPQVSTPLSIGLFSRTMRVVLPECSYTPEELSLIFRHELTHIEYQDTWMKLFLVLSKAMSWFNPLMWIAMNRSAEDLELSCDEIVLQDQPNALRQKYAALVLHTAGTQRGFTTCLSASGAAMRYRLKNITTPRKPRSVLDRIVLFAAFFLVLSSVGIVSFAYGETAGNEVLFSSQNSKEHTLVGITTPFSESDLHYVCTDPDALFDYLTSLPLEERTGLYSGMPTNYAVFCYQSPEGYKEITLSDGGVILSASRTGYSVPGGVDWAYVKSLLRPSLALNITISGKTGGFMDHEPLPATPTRIISRADGQSQILLDTDPPVNSTRSYEFPVYGAKLDFYRPLVGDVTVKVESWDGSKSYTVTQKDFDFSDIHHIAHVNYDPPGRLVLAPYPAHYTVHATLQDTDGTLFDVDYRFSVEMPVS